MIRKFHRIVFCLLLMFIEQGCDMGTRMSLRADLVQPVSDDCVENVLKSKPQINYRKNPTSLDTISSYTFWGQEYGGVIFQKRKEDGRIALDIGSIWIGDPWPFEKEKQEEHHLREIFEGMEATCSQPEFRGMKCFYSSFFSKEKRCPSSRNEPTPNQAQQR